MSTGPRIVIVGGVAGGASAAARTRRVNEDAVIIMFERGPHVSFANCGLPYHIGGVIKDRARLLVQTPESLKARLNIDVRVNTEVIAIDRAAKTVTARKTDSGEHYAEPYDVLILSPGAEPVRPPLPGIDNTRVLTLRSLSDMDAIKAVVDTGTAKHAVVVGGGYIGLEMAEALRERNVGVTLVEMLPQVMGPVDAEMATPLHDTLRRHGVDLRLGAAVKAFEERGGRLAVSLSTGDAVECDFAVLAIGVKPDVALARGAGLAIGERGGIVVDEHLRTSDPNIFAVGDAIEVKDLVGGFSTLIPLAGPANRQGRIAADNAVGRTSVYQQTQGTGICKVFDVAVGMTGMNEKALARAGRSYESITVHPASHASYYPGAQQMTLKLLFDAKDGRILGAQAVGADGVDKRIDVLATAIRAGMTVYDLENLELSYAPPYGSAKDAVNYAGFVAANVLRGDMALCHAADMANAGPDQVLLDVRTPEECDAGTIPGARNIPVDALRQRLGELPRDKEILVFCQVGMRGYLACRILQQRGFKCRNLTGGYKTYRMAFPLATAWEPLAKETQTDTGFEEKKTMSTVTKTIDACGLQCPGPIMQLRATLAALKAGDTVQITSTDAGFAADAPAWCRSTGNPLLSLVAEKGVYTAVIQKQTGDGCGAAAMPEAMSKKKTIVVFSGDFDKAMAAFIIANGAAAMGSSVTMFFTFWGINILRRPEAVRVKKNLIERMFGFMMPRGAGKLGLSKMHMAGMGPLMIKGIMRKKNVTSLPELIESAKQAGVKLIVCTMSMDLMGIKREELLDGIEEGGVAMYLSNAEQGNVNLFI